MTASQFPFSCYPRCATLSWGEKVLICMKNLEQKDHKLSYLSAYMDVGS